MSDDIPLMLQTVYADLLDRVNAAAFADAFPTDGAFIPKTIRDRRYWYFQAPQSAGRAQQYVGPETPELLERIAAHKAAREIQRDQRSLIATLVRVGNLPRPLPQVGDLLAALAREGVFRLRGVLVGTIAYQAYAAMLGSRLPATLMQTGDIDVAQFANVSESVGDATRPALEMLRAFDPTFEPVPQVNARGASSYRSRHLRVDFLTPNEGKETEEPRKLRAFGTDAQPLRFLDYLIHEPEPAVLLHGTGVPVSVPSPQRFALHKLIVSRRRREGGKREKDLMQAQALLNVLVRRRPHEIAAAWAEAFRRGKTWQKLLGEGLGLLHPVTRDTVLRTVGATRDVVPGLDMRFVPDRATYDAASDAAVFFANTAGTVTHKGMEKPRPQAGIRCSVTRDALEAALGLGVLDAAGCVEAVRRNRARLEAAARAKYLHEPVEAPDEVHLTRHDLERLEIRA